MSPCPWLWTIDHLVCTALQSAAGRQSILQRMSPLWQIKPEIDFFLRKPGLYFIDNFGDYSPFYKDTLDRSKNYTQVLDKARDRWAARRGDGLNQQRHTALQLAQCCGDASFQKKKMLRRHAASSAVNLYFYHSASLLFY